MDGDKTIYLGWAYVMGDLSVVGAFPTKEQAEGHPDVDAVEPITLFGRRS